ncbi:WXG100 family type VII secretion target [Nonomuraea bangladeshensis]|uniref:WXG100 family type VII secretion target n=1 Tax=Nonomuraea bangladeshensis TaxID=404385 RepID=UPI0031E46CEE
MTSKHQLLRQAAEKESLASTFTRYARRLTGALDGVPAHPQECEAFWTGPAAERFAERAAGLRRELAELEDTCLATAENLRRRARRLREDAAAAADRQGDWQGAQ